MKFDRCAVLAGMGLLAMSLCGCSDGTAPARDGGAAGAPSFPTPLATSVQTSDGIWATIPMGHLDDPANTFWQLLFRPLGAASWSNEVEATATATNGGLVLASPGDQRLIVAIRPSADLTYTPLISTDNAARSWSDGLITFGLSARPAALAVGGDGQALALVSGRDGAQVLTTSGDLASWRTLTTQGVLGGLGVGRSCGLGALTAVGYLSGQALVGASCARPGIIGLFAEQSGAWRLVGPALPPSVAHGRVEVMALGAAKGGGGALLGVSGAGGASLVVVWSAGNRRWGTSSPLPLVAREKVVSFGPGDGAHFFVLLQAPSGQDALMVSGSSGAWHELAPPPAGTATVAFGGTTVVALDAQGTVLTVWSLDSDRHGWSKGQVIHVAIQYGSSS
ncbi:MAG: hypothetical protein ACLP7F_04280 [Acidimicrobiales bacterium]